MEYLKTRGLNKSLDSLIFRYQKNIRQSGSGGVMFLINKEDNIWNGRIFNPGEADKSHNTGSISGHYWKHPGMKYDPEVGILGLDVAVTLMRPGYRVKNRRIRPARIGHKHRITPAEAEAWVKKEFNVKVE